MTSTLLLVNAVAAAACSLESQMNKSVRKCMSERTKSAFSELCNGQSGGFCGRCLCCGINFV